MQQRKFGRQGLALHRTELWHRRQQRLGIGLLRGAEQPGYRSIFYHFAAVHHLNPIGHFGDHAHIVSDKNHPHLHLFLQHADKLQNLRLNGDVERGGRLIGNQQGRFAAERHGDHHALTHPARQLMREAG